MSRSSSSASTWALNVVVVITTLFEVFTHPVAVGDWWVALTTQHGNPLMVVGIALLVFPKLALGLSGFETGVAVMPQIRGHATDTEENPAGRIQGARRLLTTAAVIMSAFLITTSFTTVVLIPAQDFEPGGPANGRALAFLAHEYLGNGFGTVYDLSTIAILWFAGASAMAGLLNLVPRYLPRYGMAPAWARGVRPLVLVFTLVGFLITWLFDADVDAQGGAYATGVLVLMTSAAVAVTLSARRRQQRRRTVGFGVIAVVFIYTTVANIFERPEGIRIASFFILGIIVISLLSRVRRSFELHATHVRMDTPALEFMSSNVEGPIAIIAHEPLRLTAKAYRDKLTSAIEVSHLPLDKQALVPGSDRGRLVRLRDRARGPRGGPARLPDPGSPRARGPEHHRLGAAPHQGRDRADAAHLLPLDRGKPVGEPPAVPVLRRRRDRPRHPRGAARSRTRRHETALGPRRLSPVGQLLPARQPGPERGGPVRPDPSAPGERMREGTGAGMSERRGDGIENPPAFHPR